jgi:hypothetical protein
MSTPIRLSSRYGLFLLVVSLFLVAACSDDDPSSPGTGADINGRVQLPNGRPGTEAAVYLTRVPESPPFLQPVFWDSTLVDAGGIYEFDGLNRGTYQVYAGVWSGGKSAFDLVTPFSGALDVPGEEGTKGENIVADLQLQTVQNDGQVKGMVFYDGGDLPAPVDSATVRLWIYEGPGLQLANETFSDANGSYAMTDVATGNYVVSAVKMFDISAPFPVYVSGESERFFSDGENHVTAPTLMLTDAMVEKPAVYIYPTEPGPFTVTLDLNNGTRLAFTEPEYGDGWNVAVAEDGRIDDQWDYLFYEAAINAWPLLEQGWCLAREDLSGELSNIVTDLGLNEAERADFLEYWTTRLPRHEWYLVKPVTGPDLDTWVGLDVNPTPDSVVRFWLFFQGVPEKMDVVPPPMPRVVRTGTTVVEWGGALLPQPATPGF